MYHIIRKTRDHPPMTPDFFDLFLVGYTLPDKKGQGKMQMGT